MRHLKRLALVTFKRPLTQFNSDRSRRNSFGYSRFLNVRET